ncbi:hypothetical protein CEE39_06270 [bacterium (candidate division B38) B3_B38]|nr:MAG: hypothetical protein CEE39_06270 [bacterium (candidate division B38) B3_B38]
MPFLFTHYNLLIIKQRLTLREIFHYINFHLLLLNINFMYNRKTNICQHLFMKKIKKKKSS